MKLHLGCWKRYIPGFVHVDMCDLPHIDYQHSVDSLPILEDDSVELVYASHVLEYFDREEASAAVAEHLFHPGPTAQNGVHLVLDARQPSAVDVREPDYVPAQTAVGVEPVVFLAQVNARQVQLVSPTGTGCEKPGVELRRHFRPHFVTFRSYRRPD